MLPEMIVKKIVSSQNDLIVAALKNGSKAEELATILCEHIPEQEGRFEIEEQLEQSIEKISYNLRNG